MAFNTGGRWNGPQGQRGSYQRPELPNDYLSDGYFEPGQAGGKPSLRREYIVGYPEEIARSLEDRDLNKSAQLRKFYEYAIRIRDMCLGQLLTAFALEIGRVSPPNCGVRSERTPPPSTTWSAGTAARWKTWMVRVACIPPTGGSLRRVTGSTSTFCLRCLWNSSPKYWR